MYLVNKNFLDIEGLDERLWAVKTSLYSTENDDPWFVDIWETSKSAISEIKSIFDIYQMSGESNENFR